VGTFSAERSTLLSSLGSYTDVLRRRKEALMAVQSLSGQLLEMLNAGELDNLADILKRREKACIVLARTMTGTPELSGIIARAREIAADDTTGPATSLVGLDDDIRCILADVVEKQQMCEQLLKQQIARTAEMLRQSAARRKLNAAYGPANARPQAQFLDRAR
jgi:hypothetical protein